MPTIQDTVEVEVPLHTAYDQWTQFEEFPQFMENVEEVRQLDDAHLHWVAKVGGRKQEWDAEITRQEPDRCVAWTSTAGLETGGMVTFEELAPSRTRVIVNMHYEGEGAAEKVGSAVGMDERAVHKDLERFKEMIESRGTESGSWRGTIEYGQVVEEDIDDLDRL